MLMYKADCLVKMKSPKSSDARLLYELCATPERPTR
jgi:hypothetical protein